MSLEERDDLAVRHVHRPPAVAPVIAHLDHGSRATRPALVAVERGAGGHPAAGPDQGGPGAPLGIVGLEEQNLDRAAGRLAQVEPGRQHAGVVDDHDVTGAQDVAPESEHDESFASMPNLVIIDGGKGQLGAAVAALRELGVERVPICSLAKQEELVFLPGRPDPVVLERNSPALHLVQRIRDEAHRFALGYHRTRRSAEARAGRGSVLDTLEGVGDARRRALLTFFGSPERVLAAWRDVDVRLPVVDEMRALARP